MKDEKAYVVIVVEEIAIILLGLCGLLVLAVCFLRSEETNGVIAVEPTQAPVVQHVVATPQPIPTTTLRPTPTPPPTPTPLPWTVLTKCVVIDKPGEYRLGADLTASGNCISVGELIRANSCVGCAGSSRNQGLTDLATEARCPAMPVKELESR